jgi:prepilin-type N-terminal cleavage/methylation domain-containing protein
MDCRIKNLSLGRQNSGFTLFEMLIGVLIATIVFAAVGMLMMYTSRSFLAIGNYNDLDRASQNALDTMSREIRQTQKLTSFQTNQLVFKNWNGNIDLSYTWDPVARTLTRTNGTQVTTLLGQCDFLAFHMSQRNPSSNFFFYATSDPSQAKLIDVSWRCSRQILQQKINTESVQTAKIVIRN